MKIRILKFQNLKNRDIDALVAGGGTIQDPNNPIDAAQEVWAAGVTYLRSREARPAWLDEWKKFPQLRAVRYGQLYAISADLLERHTPRILDGAERVCVILENARRTVKKFR